MRCVVVACPGRGITCSIRYGFERLSNVKHQAGGTVGRCARPSHRRVRVSDKGGCWLGDRPQRQAPLVALFTRFEEVVYGQMLSFLDEMEAEIQQLGARLLTGRGRPSPVDDLQIYPAERGFPSESLRGESASGLEECCPPTDFVGMRRCFLGAQAFFNPR